MAIKIPPIIKIQIAAIKRKRIKKVRNKSPTKIKLFNYQAVVEIQPIILRKKMIFPRFGRGLTSL